MYVKLLKEKQMKKGLKIAAIVVGVIIILMLLLPFAFQGKIAGIVKTRRRASNQQGAPAK